MDDPLPLVADVLRRKLPEAKILAGEHKLAGTALVDVDVTVDKLPPSLAEPTLPYKAILAVLANSLGATAANVIGRAARQAMAKGDVPMPATVEAALDKVRSQQKRKSREGSTKVTGTVALFGFAPAELVLPGWPEIKASIANQRRAA